MMSSRAVLQCAVKGFRLHGTPPQQSLLLICPPPANRDIGNLLDGALYSSNPSKPRTLLFNQRVDLFTGRPPSPIFEYVNSMENMLPIEACCSHHLPATWHICMACLHGLWSRSDTRTHALPFFSQDLERFPYAKVQQQ